MSQAYKTWAQPGANPRPAGVNPDIVARAEAALKALSSQFSAWLQDEVDKLEAAHRRVVVEGLAGGPGDTLYTHAHDLKGLGSTYEFPVVTRIAGSLCRLLDADRTTARLTLVTAHVDAIKSVVRDNIRDESHPVARPLIASLEANVRAVGR